jgi:hypothetical protein
MNNTAKSCRWALASVCLAWCATSFVARPQAAATLAAALASPQNSCPVPATPTNGIYIDSIKIYDEASLELLIVGAKSSLSALNPFDQTTLVNHLGGLQGSTIAQSQSSLQVTGPSQILASGNSTGTAPNNPTLTLPTPPAFTAPATFSTSAVDVLNEAMQLNSQIIGYQLLLEGSLNDQFYQGSNRSRNRVTLGFPINIEVPQGYKYRGAVAEVEAAVCTSIDTVANEPPSLSMLIPQDKTYNVASLVSKSASIGGGLIAGVVNVGGGFLRARQSYYLVQDQDTVATQRPNMISCPGGRRPVTFAWQFRPVLGEKVVRDGIRHTYAQVSFPRPVPNAGGALNAVAVLHTAWRRYDASTGRVGDYLDPREPNTLCIPNFDNPPTPQSVSATDNGDGTVNVIARGAFRLGTRVRIGDTVLDPTVTGFEQTQRYIRFNAPALTIARYGADLVNRNGAEAEVRIRASSPIPTAGAVPIPGLDPITDVTPHRAPAGAPLTLTISATGGIFFSGGGPAVTAVTADDCHVTISGFNVVNANTLTVNISTPPAAVGVVEFTISVGATTYKSGRRFSLTSSAVVEPFSDSTSLVRFLRPCGSNESLPDVAVIGSKLYGLRDAPFYQRTPGGEISILVPNDQLRLHRQLLWKRLFTDESAEYDLPFPPPAPAGVSDFSVSNITLLSYTAASGGASTPSVSPSDVTVSIPGKSATGTARFAVGNGQPALFAIDPAVAHQGETVPVRLVGAFTHFSAGTTLLFSNPGVSVVSTITVDDANHLRFSLSVSPTAAPGAVNITAITGNEIAIGPSLFSVSNAPMITAIAPPTGAAGAPVNVTVTGMGTHFLTGITKLYLSNGSVTVSALNVVSPTQLTATLNIPASVSGTLSLRAVTRTETAVSRPLFIAGTASPDIVSVYPAAGQPGQSLPGVAITGAGTNFTLAAPTVTFSNSNVKVRGVPTVTGTTTLTANLDVAADAASAPAAASTAGKPTNTYAITGSRLRDLHILVPPNVSLDVNTDTLVTFSLTDDQAKAFKSIVVQHGTDLPVVAGLPAAPAASPATPAAPSIKAATVALGASTVTLTGTGMSQVVSVRYLDTPLAFSTKGDTSLTINQLPALTPPSLKLVFVYADKSLKPYDLTVQAQGPK